MSRGVYLLGVSIAVVALAFAVTDWVIGPTPGVTETNARRIKPGMTLREMEAILGARGVGMVDAPGSTIFFSRYWTGPNGRVVVKLDLSASKAGGWELKVARNGVSFERTASPNPLARLRAWLGW
jgi:hypothetical protein